jgi:anti-sigma factor RsiW
MHEPVIDGLEEYLAGTADGARLAAIQRHLDACPPCRAMVAAMRAHQQIFASLRCPQPVSPAPGFYARVRQRIEQQRAASIWSLFVQPAFSRRLSYASLALLLLLTAAVWQSGPEPVIDQGNPMAVFALDLPEASGLDPGHDRAVVLTHLVSAGGEGDELLTLPVSSD